MNTRLDIVSKRVASRGVVWKKGGHVNNEVAENEEILTHRAGYCK